MNTRQQNFINAIKTTLEANEFKISNYNAQKAFALDSSLTIAEKSKEAADQFFYDEFLPSYLHPNKRMLKEKDKLKQYYALLANFKLSSPTLPMRISLHTNQYTNDKFFSKFVIDMFHWLNEGKYLHVRKGYSLRSAPVGKQTRLCASNKFKEHLLNKIEIRCVISPLEKDKYVKLRGTKSRKNLKYTDNKYTLKIKNRIHNINYANSQHLVEIPRRHGRQFLSSVLHAVYNNNSFSSNGRLYTGSHGYQALRKEERKTILIDGCETVEFDYSGLHPRMLYAMKGIDYVDDPYSSVIQEKEMRPILKILLLALINSKSESFAVNAGNTSLFTKPHLRLMLKAKNWTVKQLVKLFIKTHQEIAEYFLTQQGFKLMNIDSQLAISVVEHFSSQGKACLPVHDSFLVKKEDSAELDMVMRSTYSTILRNLSPLNKYFTCVISQS